MKNKKKNKKETLNDGILEFLEAQSPSVGQELRYPISNNFYFWSVSIRALYQNLWPFKFFRPKSMINLYNVRTLPSNIY